MSPADPPAAPPPETGPGSETGPVHAARHFPIRLAYLFDCAENPVDWAFDAYDAEGRYYYITARRGELAISREGVLVHLSRFGDEDDSIRSLEALRALAGPRGLFDRSLLESGTACVCGYAYERDKRPPTCRLCGATLRGAGAAGRTDGGAGPTGTMEDPAKGEDPEKGEDPATGGGE